MPLLTSHSYQHSRKQIRPVNRHNLCENCFLAAKRASFQIAQLSHTAMAEAAFIRPYKTSDFTATAHIVSSSHSCSHFPSKSSNSQPSPIPPHNPASTR